MNSLCQKHTEDVFPIFIRSHHAITQDGAPFSEETHEGVEENCSQACTAVSSSEYGAELVTLLAPMGN